MRFLTYVLNVDRHAERLAVIGAALDAQGMAWRRFSAIDATRIAAAELDRLVCPVGQVPPFLDGARACTAGHLKMFAEIAEGPDEHALILEDDAEPSPALAGVLDRLLALRRFDVLNINRQTPRGRRKRLIVGSDSLDFGPCGVIRDLAGIHYGTAGYVIGRSAARRILAICPRPDMPIDHLLFNPNISPIHGRLRVEQLFPALVRPRRDVETTIQIRPPDMADPVSDRLRRLGAELRIVPRLLVGAAMGRYRICDLDFRTEAWAPEAVRPRA